MSECPGAILFELTETETAEAKEFIDECVHLRNFVSGHGGYNHIQGKHLLSLVGNYLSELSKASLVEQCAGNGASHGVVFLIAGKDGIAQECILISFNLVGSEGLPTIDFYSVDSLNNFNCKAPPPGLVIWNLSGNITFLTDNTKMTVPNKRNRRKSLEPDKNYRGCVHKDPKYSIEKQRALSLKRNRR